MDETDRVAGHIIFAIWLPVYIFWHIDHSGRCLSDAIHLDYSTQIKLFLVATVFLGAAENEILLSINLVPGLVRVNYLGYSLIRTKCDSIIIAIRRKSLF